MMLNCVYIHTMFLETWKYTDTKRANEETFDQRFACVPTSTMRQWSSTWQWSNSPILKIVTDSDRTNTSYTRSRTSCRKAFFAKLSQSHCLDCNIYMFDDAFAGASIRVVVPRIVYFASIPSKHLIDLQCLSTRLKAAQYISKLTKQCLFSQMSNFEVIPSIHFHHVISARL